MLLQTRKKSDFQIEHIYYKNNFAHLLKDKMILRTTEMDFNGNKVYAGLIIRRDNPEAEQILEAFDNFTELAPSMYNIQSK